MIGARGNIFFINNTDVCLALKEISRASFAEAEAMSLNTSVLFPPSTRNEKSQKRLPRSNLAPRNVTGGTPRDGFAVLLPGTRLAIVHRSCMWPSPLSTAVHNYHTRRCFPYWDADPSDRPRLDL